MAQVFNIHPVSPQARLVTQAAATFRTGAVVAYPTDSSYALGCCLGEKRAMDRIKRMRGLTDDHFMTLVCRDLSEISTYAKVSNSAYRMLRAHTPGPFTFILTATRDVPRRLQDPKRRTIGLRIPSHPVVAALLEALGEPLMSATLKFPDRDEPVSEVEDIGPTLAKTVDLIIDSGACGIEPTTIVDLSDDQPKLLRQGAGQLEGGLI